RREIVLHRITTKERAVRDLLTGRLTLGQAAAQFRDVEREAPATSGHSSSARGPADGESLCREVMARAVGWVKVNLPEATAQVAARPEAELQQLGGPDGVVCLPD